MGRIIFKRVMLSLVSILIILTIGEIVMRRVYGDGFLSLVDPKLHHRRRPYLNIERTWGSGERFKLITNSLGWRDKNIRHKIKKITDKKKRIVFLGDSFTEGVGYNQEYTFSGIIENLLREKGFNCEVLNGGTASYSPLLEYIRLKRFLDEGYKTDIVVLLPDPSDVQDEAMYNARYIFDQEEEPVRLAGRYYAYPALCRILNYSCLARASATFLRNIYGKSSNWITKIRSSQIKVANPNPSEKSEPKDNSIITSQDLFGMDLSRCSKLRWNWEVHNPSLMGWAWEGLTFLETDIGRIKSICDKNGILLIVAIYPSPQQLYIEEDQAYYKTLREYFHELYAARESFYGTKPQAVPSIYESVVVSFCERHEIELVNLYPEFMSKEDRHEYFIRNDIHMNNKGHRFIAEKTIENLMKKIR